jgi:hypothetical protein
LWIVTGDITMVWQVVRPVIDFVIETAKGMVAAE